LVFIRLNASKNKQVHIHLDYSIPSDVIRLMPINKGQKVQKISLKAGGIRIGRLAGAVAVRSILGSDVTSKVGFLGADVTPGMGSEKR